MVIDRGHGLGSGYACAGWFGSGGVGVPVVRGVLDGTQGPGRDQTAGHPVRDDAVAPGVAQAAVAVRGPPVRAGLVH